MGVFGVAPKKEIDLLAGTREPTENSDFLLGFKDYLQKTGEKGTKRAKSQGTLVKRRKFRDLEYCYVLDEVVFRCVNFYAEQVIGVGFDFVGGKKVVNVCQKFFQDNDVYQKLKDAVRDMCICGNGFMEKIRGKTKKLVDLQRMDYKKTDYIRNEMGFVKVDNSGKPMGYAYGKYAFENIVSEGSFEGQEFNMNDVVHFTLASLGTELAVGFVEPVVEIVRLKRNTINAISSPIQKMITPFWIEFEEKAGGWIHVKVGDKPDERGRYRGHEVTSDIVSKLNTAWNTIQKRFKHGSLEDMHKLLEWCDARIIVPFGLPADMVFGSATRKSNLDVILPRDVDLRIKGIQNEIAEELLRNVIPEILKANGLSSENLPQIRFRDPKPVDLNRKAKRISTYIKFGVLEPNDVREQVLKDEQIEGRPAKIKEEPVKKEPKGKPSGEGDPTKGEDSVKGRDKSREVE